MRCFFAIFRRAVVVAPTLSSLAAMALGWMLWPHALLALVPFCPTHAHPQRCKSQIVSQTVVCHLESKTTSGGGVPLPTIS